MSAQIEIIIIACLVAVACAIPGVLLVLRKMSLMSDAISHSILLGIIIAFLFVKNLGSPLLIIGAAIMGVITVSLTELLRNTNKVKEDAAIGLVFPALFSIAIILITKFASGVHIDTDAVLLGEIAFAPFDRLSVFGMDIGPQSMWIMAAILIINVAFVLLFYKELKLSTFDAGLAATLGFMPALLHYGLMSIISITAVGAFDIVGSVLVVAFVIAPPAAAYLLTERLDWMLIISSILGMVSAISGYFFALAFDVSIAGSMASMTGVLFVLTLIFAPQKGLLSKAALYWQQKWVFATHMLAVHLLDHEGREEENIENRVSTLHRHLNWEEGFSRKVIRKAVSQELVLHEGEMLRLTSLGRETAKRVMSE
ncbi:MAG TPA: metal ABC transporter permease [Candidatus Nanoarchaeia archaeon]|nr:metal ABC transporter permease [Candidatus Nanoarchaeia archaeon]